MIDFARARKAMVDNQLRTAGITDRRLLVAMGDVPREKFLPAVRQPLAYIDEPQPLSATRRLGAPAPFARLVQLAAITHSDRVLDLGCGTGYSSAVLSQLAAVVVAVEEDPALAAAARSNLSGYGNIEVRQELLALGGRGRGPFDVAIVEGTVDDVPDAFFAELKSEGRLVALIRSGNRPPVAHLFVKSPSGIASSAAFDARLPSLAAPADPGFVF